MYKIIATEAFVDIICELPLKHISPLVRSFTSIEKLDDKEVTLTERDDTFIIDLLEQIKNQEME